VSDEALTALHGESHGRDPVGLQVAAPALEEPLDLTGEDFHIIVLYHLG
jgi:hypothetical protein